MKKYMIGFLIFIGCIQSLCADDNSGLFDYVASRDEVVVLSMIQKDFDLFNDLGLQINKFDKTILDEQGRVCSIKVVREDACTIGAIFYTSYLQCGSNYCEIKFLAVDELHQDKGYGSFMIKSIFNEMSELTGDGSSMFGPLIDISRCRAFDEGFIILDFTELPFLNFAPLLHCAIFFNDIEYLEIFIKEGADLNEVYAGNTPLMLAIEVTTQR